ncbi:hypothetical protein D3C87_1692150 [compost metagenome]
MLIGWGASFGGKFDGLTVCFLTIAYRERETWAAELVGNFRFLMKETLAVTFYQETNTSFLDVGWH